MPTSSRIELLGSPAEFGWLIAEESDNLGSGDKIRGHQSGLTAAIPIGCSARPVARIRKRCLLRVKKEKTSPRAIVVRHVSMLGNQEAVRMDRSPNAAIRDYLSGLKPRMRSFETAWWISCSNSNVARCTRPSAVQNSTPRRHRPPGHR